MLGAAGNVARNVAALGATAALVGVIGDDAAGNEALRLCRPPRPASRASCVPPGRPHHVKTRFVSAGQQLLRVD